MLARQEKNPKLRTRLTGKTGNTGVRHYTHKPGVKCGCRSRSVQCEEIEADFGKLVSLFTIDDENIDMLTRLAVELDELSGIKSDVDLEQKRREAIVLAQRKLDAAIHLYGDGMISREDYLHRVKQAERDIAYWENKTTETEKIAVELATCVNAVKKLADLWEDSEAEDKQGMAQYLFEYLIYDLDTHRIVDFRLKDWAERYLILRGHLYLEENKKNTDNDVQGMGNDMLPTGLEIVSVPMSPSIPLILSPSSRFSSSIVLLRPLSSSLPPSSSGTGSIPVSSSSSWSSAA
jgi:hypothetical protein